MFFPSPSTLRVIDQKAKNWYEKLPTKYAWMCKLEFGQNSCSLVQKTHKLSTNYGIYNQLK